ncbi:MAG: hypothetical protein QGH97_03545 [Dehalococcoidia bacterium]|jgi:hypothetical protein|nr:hypothetical protein [Dehalococcoidia bacterium]MDP7083436.1 hypothetical protein [Dehalococcoidia bacterium]MDP7511206.1 hypothetical protein [Dehalococcoidia bacterium]
MTTSWPRRASEKDVETFTHEEACRRYISTAEYQSVMNEDDQDWAIN